MASARPLQIVEGRASARQLFDRIGAFLTEQRLEPNPANFAFAWHLLSDPQGPLAKAVAVLTEGGVRLTQRDIDGLDCAVRPVPNIATAPAARADGLVARTQMQVEGFADIVDAMRIETADFGRDLAASAAAMRNGEAQLEATVRLTAAMLERVRTTEAKLESATLEASELRSALEEARDNARRDPLTDLPNRRAFEEAYAARSAAGDAICLAVCDVDHFKAVNDRFGHAVGDRVLKAIAEALARTCTGHLVARYGGEEFVVLFAGTDLDAARDLLDRARCTVAAKQYRLRETDAPLGEVTFSAGITAAAPGDRCGTTFGKADRLLYAAKEAGRNCILG